MHIWNANDTYHACHRVEFCHCLIEIAATKSLLARCTHWHASCYACHNACIWKATRIVKEIIEKHESKFELEALFMNNDNSRLLSLPLYIAVANSASQFGFWFSLSGMDMNTVFFIFAVQYLLCQILFSFECIYT